MTKKKQGRKKRPDRRRGGNVVAVSMELYRCAEPGCNAAGLATDMYNTPVNPSRVGGQQLLPLIRCRNCAEKIAAAAGKRLHEKMCGVYPLHFTLKKMAEAAAKRTSDAEAKTNRLETVKQYAREYAASGYGGDTPHPSPNLNTEGYHLCGVPTDCCRHDRPVDRFLTTMDGQVVGCCGLAAKAFIQVYRELADEDGQNGPQRLLWTSDLNQANRIASRLMRGR